MLPKPCGTISWPADRSTLKLPRRLTWTTRSNSSPAYLRIGLRTLIDGVQTRPSSRLFVAAASTMASLTDVSLVMSTTPHSALPPAFLIVFAVSLACPALISRHHTCAPCSATPIPHAWPMPDPAPITATVFPSRLNRFFVIDSDPYGSEGPEA